MNEYFFNQNNFLCITSFWLKMKMLKFSSLIIQKILNEKIFDNIIVLDKIVFWEILEISYKNMQW